MWHHETPNDGHVDGLHPHTHVFPPFTQHRDLPRASRARHSPASTQLNSSLSAPPPAVFSSGRQWYEHQPQPRQEHHDQAMTPVPDIANAHDSFTPTPAPRNFSASLLPSTSDGLSSLFPVLPRSHSHRPPRAVPPSQIGYPALNVHNVVHGCDRSSPPLQTFPSSLPYPHPAFMVRGSESSLSSSARAWSLSGQAQPSLITASDTFITNTDPNPHSPHVSNASEGPAGLLAASAAAITTTTVPLPSGARLHSDQTSHSPPASKQRKPHNRSNQGCLTCRARHKKCSALKHDDDLDEDGRCSTCVRLKVECLRRYGQSPPAAWQDKERMKALTAAIAQHTKQRPRHQGPSLRLEHYCHTHSTILPDTVPPPETHVTSLIPSAVPTNPNAKPPPTFIAESAYWGIPSETNLPLSFSHLPDTATYSQHLLNVSTYTLPPGPDLPDPSMHSSPLLRSPVQGLNSRYMDGTSSSALIITQTPAIPDAVHRVVNANDNVSPAFLSPDAYIFASGPSWDVNGSFSPGSPGQQQQPSTRRARCRGAKSSLERHNRR